MKIKYLIVVAVVLFSIPSVSSAAILRPLAIGSQGIDVSELQQTLKNLGLYTHPEITGYYGLVTAQAVAAFQISNNLEGIGSVGPQTRALLNNLQNTSTAVTVTPPPSVPGRTLPVTGGGNSSSSISRNLYRGVEGPDVLVLQNLLKQEGLLTVEPNGYFGPSTEQAVRLFQIRNNISPLGQVGPATRTKINEVQAARIAAATPSPKTVTSSSSSRSSSKSSSRSSSSSRTSSNSSSGGSSGSSSGSASNPESTSSVSSTQTQSSPQSSTPAPGINIVSGVLWIVGDPTKTNKIEAWVMEDGSMSWPVLNGLVKSIHPNEYSAVKIVKTSSADSVTVGQNFKVPVTVTESSVLAVAPVPNPQPTPVISTPVQMPTPVQPVQQPQTQPQSNQTTNTQSPTVRINTIATTILPGQSVFVHGLDSDVKSGTLLDAKYEWDFGDSGSHFNQLTGWNAAHIYDRSGTYTVKLKVTNKDGKSSTATQAISVSSDTRKTLYVDAANGSDSNTGTNQNQPLQTLVKAASLMSSGTKILLAKGGTYPVSSTISFVDNLTLDAYGNGASPVILWTGGLNNYPTMFTSYSNQKNIVIANLTFDTQNPAIEAATVFGLGGTGITIRNNTFLNVSTVVNANGNPTGLMIQDNSAPRADGVRGYFVWLQGTDSVIIGNTVANSVYQHDIRASFGYSRTLIADNTLANLDRRYAGGNPNDFSKDTINMQYGSYVYVRNNKVTDGSIRIGPLGGTDEIKNFPTTAAAERTNWIVVENNTLINIPVQMKHGSENGVVRNNTVKRSSGALVEVEEYDSVYRRGVSNVTLENNTSN